MTYPPLKPRSWAGLLSTLITAACLLMTLPTSGLSQKDPLSEHEIKTAYLYNFVKYVEWPTSAFTRDNSPLTICIVGSSPLNSVIETLAGKTVRNRRLVVRYFSRIEDLSECQILFINSTVRSPVAQILTAAASRSILTVGDAKGFSAAGGMIELAPSNGKIRFIINNRAAQSASLQISSHLLRLAVSSQEKP